MIRWCECKECPNEDCGIRLTEKEMCYGNVCLACVDGKHRQRGK